ncbi:hypothetical protein B0H14DRAFT_2592179 [Mycena olivaceomarginata]|nr:hypothetical protein B0H14DRAFT_2592179 [Mycena olivaceomarginata]
MCARSLREAPRKESKTRMQDPMHVRATRGGRHKHHDRGARLRDARRQRRRRGLGVRERRGRPLTERLDGQGVFQDAEGCAGADGIARVDGIKPFCSPNCYDQRGDLTTSSSAGLICTSSSINGILSYVPAKRRTFLIEKNQSWVVSIGAIEKLLGAGLFPVLASCYSEQSPLKKGASASPQNIVEALDGHKVASEGHTCRRDHTRRWKAPRSPGQVTLPNRCGCYTWPAEAFRGFRSWRTLEGQYTVVVANALQDLGKAAKIPVVDTACSLILAAVPPIQNTKSRKEQCLQMVEDIHLVLCASMGL